ncbi:glycosyltransferase family 2 protein [Candidatus Berkelbacteria bacterium]|nr:glycosyltransferase family 2 protein [Candidatus Berkelbacteria bacterium]
MRSMRLVIVIPSYNEAAVIGNVLTALPARLDGIGAIETVVVDDGSRDQTAAVARDKGARVIVHAINRGLGGALGTGLEYARRRAADLVVTLDADGQHDAQEIIKLIQPILDGRADVVIGSRLINARGMPWYRILGNRFLNLMTFVFFGIWSTDSQSGMRAFNRKAIDTIAIETNRMEVSSEIIHQIKRHNLRYAEVPIRAIYTNYSLKKGQRNVNALKILTKLILEKITN